MDVPHAQPRFSLPFAGAYFFYYAGYCVFSSYAVMYLTQLGCSASLCGILTSLTLCANLAMEPVGGYITDTFLPTKHYLMLCIGAIGALCLACTALAAHSGFTLAAIVLIAGLAYPFSQLMDAWVNCSRELDGSLVYSRVRSAGSVGFALTSAAAGLFFQRFGWGGYFVLQALLFGAMLPFLFRLPAIRLGNRMQTHRADHLSVTGAFATALKSPRFRFGLLLGTLFWCSHRPVGSYLSLIVTQRQGGSEVFGLVCAAGSAMESLALLALSLLTRKWSLHRRMGAALAANLLRPAILALLPGIWPLYLGQIFQSVSFAIYYAAIVDYFTQAADERIRSFSISMGLTVTSAVGTVLANLAGGSLCDALGAGAMAPLSLCLSLLVFVLFALRGRAYTDAAL